MSEPRLPESLRRAIAADSGPMRRMPPPGLRMLEAVLLAVALGLVALAVYRLRADAGSLGWLLVWGPAALQCLTGAALVGLAVREAVPGWSVGRGRLVGAMALGFAVQLGSVAAAWVHGPLVSSEVLAHAHGMACASREAMLSLPLLVCAVFFVLRALPVRPRWSGALAGMGAGVIADGLWHLVCPVSNLEHVLVWHVGATAVATVAGWLLGVAWELRERRRLAG